MKNMRWRPGGLSWRLAVSYFLVTLVAALTIEITLTVVQLVQELQQSSASAQASAPGKQDVIGLAPFLEQTPPDAEALRYWLTFDVITRSVPRIHLVVVLDEHQQVIVSASCSQPELLSSGSSACASRAASLTGTELAQPRILSTLRQIMASPGQLSNALPGNENFTVMSVPGPSRQVLGVLLVVFGPASTEGATGAGPLLANLLNVWLPAGLYFLLLAALLGTVTGILISRNLTRRLSRIARAAAAWSRGEFQVVIQDRSRDELGGLAGDLNSMAEQLKSLLATRQALSISEERNRLARELHDSVKQQMFTSALLVRAARKLLLRDPEGAGQHLVEAEALSEQVQQELSAAIQALRPANLVEKDLAMVLQEYTHDWSQRVGIQVDTHVQGERSTPLQVEEALFRVVQEALANVARHSGASEVKIHLAWTEDQAGLSICDNGRGFDTARPTGKGLGLVHMRERVETLSGRFSISSSAEGTRVEAQVPLVPDDASIKAEAHHE